MVNKKTKKTVKKKVETPSVGVSKNIKKQENRQLILFFVVIAIIFLSFLVPYFLIQASKTFNYGDVDWVFEEDVNYYHGRFAGLTNDAIMYNIYVRNDPRENNVPTDGTFDDFKYGAIISTSPEFDMCRGEASRVMRDLGDFLKTAVGTGVIYSGSTDPFVAMESERRYALCDNIQDRTLVIVDVGNNSVAQDSKNSYCYKIYVEDCNDASAVEKFMLKSIIDFGGAE
jgi:hypothetical protein